MNTSSENNAHFEGGNARPFFYVHAMGQQPYPSPRYQNPTYNPFSVPGAGKKSKFSGVRDPPPKAMPDSF